MEDKISINVMSTFTMEEVFKNSKVNIAFKRALELESTNLKNTKLYNVAHYDIYKSLDMGNINISGRIKNLVNTKIYYRTPVSVVYNKEKLGAELNLTAVHLKKIVLCAIHERVYKPWNKIPHISIGAVRGHCRRAIALYTGLSYDTITKVTEHKDITRLGKKFVSELINNQGFDLVLAPYALMKIYFDGHFDISNIDGKNPQDPEYHLNDYLLWVSHNGKNLEIQKKVANTFNNANLLKELKKVGIFSLTNETCIEHLYKNRPDLFEPHIKI